MRENQLNELQGVSILTKDFFNKLIRRIESTKPLAGAGITIKQEENGILISGGSVAGYSAITLNGSKFRYLHRHNQWKPSGRRVS